MREKPELRDEQIINCMWDEYGLSVETISLLPLGADRSASVYRVVANDGTSYFVKIKKGNFSEASVAIPNFLSTVGMKQVIQRLRPKQVDSGQISIPSRLFCILSSQGILPLKELCRANNGALYIIDWDRPIFAPKERELMFIGGGYGDSGYTPQEEETMFYQGYGQTNINQIAIADYRYERIIVDMVDNSDVIFLSEEGERTRKEALEDIRSMFLPNGKIEMAYRSDTDFKKS